jgi:hypothetical protein
VSPDHPIFDAASKAAPSDAADVTRLLTAIVRVRSIALSYLVTCRVRDCDCAGQVRHREAAHVVKKTKVSLLPLLPHANENQLGQLAQVRLEGLEHQAQPAFDNTDEILRLWLKSGQCLSRTQPTRSPLPP